MRAFFRPFVFFVFSVLSFIYVNGILWVLFFILFMFYTAVDYFGVDKNANNVVNDCSADVVEGVLGEYVVDGENCFGAYVKLLGWVVFIDIKCDDLFEARKGRALYILNNIDRFEKSLECFLVGNPYYKNMSVSCIGIHSRDLMQGEVFWEPNGYTLLLGDAFVVCGSKNSNN